MHDDASRYSGGFREADRDVQHLVETVRSGLVARADPAAGPGMQAYMKSAVPFLGVAAPARADLLRELRPLLCDRAVVGAAAERLWDGARFREERYAATALERRWAPQPERLAVHRHWIVSGAWWDHVDEIAARLVGPALRADRAAVTPMLRAWARAPDRWLRRTVVICQLAAKDDTDLELLTESIEANVDDGDFFLRKGIGWALRQYARTDPEWVRSFVAAHPPSRRCRGRRRSSTCEPMAATRAPCGPRGRGRTVLPNPADQCGERAEQ
jgi:3-methyladenine DNA glycosylase AlkD